jgi:hypothetical protein
MISDNEKLPDLHRSPSVVSISIPRVKHAETMGEIKNIYRILGRKIFTKKLLEDRGDGKRTLD